MSSFLTKLRGGGTGAQGQHFQILIGKAPTYLLLTFWQWGTGNVYLLVLSKAKCKHCRKPHCHNEVADTLEPKHVPSKELVIEVYGLALIQ